MTHDSCELVNKIYSRFSHVDEVSKSRLAMACHYFLKDKIHRNSNNIDFILKSIQEMIDYGILQENENGNYVLAVA
jgi:hypothetical protein